MEQKITIKIGGSTYSLKASSPEQERLMRIAAEHINKKLVDYDRRFPERSLSDKLAFVALNEAVSMFSLANKINLADEEAAELHNQTTVYLDNINKSGR
ncbi:MAG: cell division protein ZapA [Bacteroidales bacterium]|jgi:cell division protein ZapA (FtsZ GTPase activity inhibitor)|nr:cell division protein ZapA [Bacteroidales bacterium]MCI1786162.1 cell division protein ZapA [Bacteroidales bacterium]